MITPFQVSLSSQWDGERAEVEQAKARDPRVWAAWHERYFPVIYRYAFARTGRREDAEDIAAQTFLRALERIDAYDYRGRPVLAWLYRISHNLVADGRRRNGRRPEFSLDGAVAPAIPAADHGGPSVEIRDAIARLKPDQAEVLTLRYLVSLNTREIAQLMGKSEAAVYSLHVRALQNLRAALKDT